MASKNKTERLGLNLWVDTDRPQRADFNNDNMILEEQVGNHLASESLHLTESEKARASAPLGYTGYVGNGESTREITLPANALAAVVYCVGMPSETFDRENNCLRVYKAVAVYGAGAQRGVTLSGNKVTVTRESQPADGALVCLNEQDRQYRVMIIR